MYGAHESPCPCQAYRRYDWDEPKPDPTADELAVLARHIEARERSRVGWDVPQVAGRVEPVVMAIPPAILRRHSRAEWSGRNYKKV